MRQAGVQKLPINLSQTISQQITGFWRGASNNISDRQRGGLATVTVKLPVLFPLRYPESEFKRDKVVGKCRVKMLRECLKNFVDCWRLSDAKGGFKLVTSTINLHGDGERQIILAWSKQIVRSIAARNRYDGRFGIDFRPIWLFIPGHR